MEKSGCSQGHNYRFFIVLTIYILALCYTPFTLAQKKVYYVGVEDVPYYPLFDFKTQKQTFTRELLDKFAHSKGYTFVYVPLPIKRFPYWLTENKIDFKYPDNARWYSDPNFVNQFVFSNSTLKLVAGTTVLTTNLKKPPSEFKALGTLLGFYPTTWIKQIKKGNVRLIEDSSTLILIQHLINQNVDGIDIEPSVINYHLKKLGQDISQVAIDKKYEYQVYDFHLSTIKHQDVIDEFNQFIHKNKNLIKNLKQKYEIIDHTPYLN